MPKLDQETQIRNSDLYDDTIPAGSGLETPASADQNILFDLNGLRSQVRRIIDPQGLVGTADWYVSVATALDNFGLRQIHDKKFVFKSPRDANNWFRIGLPEISTVQTVADAGGSLNNKYFIFYESPTKAYYVWYNVNGAGVDPTPTPPGGVTFVGIMVAIATNATAGTVASATHTAINLVSGIRTTLSVVLDTITLTNNDPGNVTDTSNAGGGSSPGFLISTTQQGTNSTAQGVLISSAKLAGGSGIIAVGPSSAQNNAYVAATEANFTIAGTLGVGLSTAASGQAVVLNRVDIMAEATDDPPLDGGTKVFGLLQALSGTADGAAVAGPGSENLQISFVKIDPNTNALIAVTLPAGDYEFQVPFQQSFYGLDRGALLSGGELPDIIDPGSGSAPRLPWRQFNVTSNAAAGETFNIQTGVFSGTGVSTVFASFGTPILPATAVQFRDDNRPKIWRNGVLQAKGPGEDVTWVSPTQVSFVTKVKANDRIQVESPASFS